MIILWISRIWVSRRARMLRYPRKLERARTLKKLCSMFTTTIHLSATKIILSTNKQAISCPFPIL